MVVLCSKYLACWKLLGSTIFCDLEGSHTLEFSWRFIIIIALSRGNWNKEARRTTKIFVRPSVYPTALGALKILLLLYLALTLGTQYLKPKVICTYIDWSLYCKNNLATNSTLCDLPWKAFQGKYFSILETLVDLNLKNRLNWGSNGSLNFMKRFHKNFA